MRAVTILLAFAFAFAFASAGCSFHVEGVDRGGLDLGAFQLDSGGGAPADLAGAADLASSTAMADLARGPDLAGPFLVVSGAATQPATDLTKEGNVDWAHWGFALASDYDHRAKGNGQIANYTLIGALNALQYGDGAVSYKWNDGAGGFGQHSNSMGPSTTGVYVGGKDQGLRVTAPADATARHLRFYVGGYKVTGQLHVALSDNSVPVFEDHAFGSATGSFNVTYDVKYAAGTTSQLILSWTLYGGDTFGNVSLQSATLLTP